MIRLAKLGPRLKVPSMFCWVICFLLIAYPLSFRPGMWLEEKGIISGDTAETIYSPLFSLAAKSDLFSKVLYWWQLF
jgi:hypothetical protein